VKIVVWEYYFDETFNDMKIFSGYNFKMAEGIEASNTSCISLFNNIANISGSRCLSYAILKSELQKLQDELKTAQLVIDLLQKEVRSKNVECINTSE
jgi:hypothetical protein